MRLTSKDAVGLALAASTVALLVVHGVDRHEAPDTATDHGASTPAGSADEGRPSIAERQGPHAVAFVDVNLISEPGGERRRHQVVLVRDGQVAEVGPTGTVQAPAGALVVEGHGSSYLMAGSKRPGQEGVDWAPVAAGARADLLLLPTDPTSDGTAYSNLEGRMVGGAWYPVERVRRPPARGDGVAGGH